MPGKMTLREETSEEMMVGPRALSSGQCFLELPEIAGKCHREGDKQDGNPLVSDPVHIHGHCLQSLFRTFLPQPKQILQYLIPNSNKYFRPAATPVVQ